MINVYHSNDKNQNIISYDNNTPEYYDIPTNLTSFYLIPVKFLTIIDVSYRPISDFRGISYFSHLETLIAVGTNISSYRGASKIPSLRNIDLTDTPISKKPIFRKNILGYFGYNIEIINKKVVSPNEKGLIIELVFVGIYFLPFSWYCNLTIIFGAPVVLYSIFNAYSNIFENLFSFESEKADSTNLHSVRSVAAYLTTCFSFLITLLLLKNIVHYNIFQ